MFDLQRVLTSGKQFEMQRIILILTTAMILDDIGIVMLILMREDFQCLGFARE
jgi:hypothetical protein